MEYGDIIVEPSINEAVNGSHPDNAAGKIFTTGKGFTVTVTCAVDVQPLMSPVTV
jgi:hypothetical protein